jgi:hypothetical protein
VTKVPVDSNGLFNVSFAAGASLDNQWGYSWANGTYKVYAYHEGGLYAVTTFQWSGPSETTSTTTTYTETTSSYTNTTQEIKEQIQNYLCGSHSGEDHGKLPPSIPVAYYAVYTNGTLYRINYTSLILAVAHYHSNYYGDKNSTKSLISTSSSALGFTLMPGQSVTFTFNGTIDTLSPDLMSYIPRNFAVPSSLFTIDAGMEYTVAASGPFATRIATITNATST